MAVPPLHLEKRVASDTFYHCRMQEEDMHENVRSKNLIPRKVNCLQERRPREAEPDTACRSSVNRSQYFSSLGHFTFLLNVCSISRLET